MRLFTCQTCEQILFFENDRCEKCDSALGYLPGPQTLSVVAGENGALAAAADPGRTYRTCANAAHGLCNWLVGPEETGDYCLACRHNRTIADPTVPENLRRWRLAELAKHRLFYSLLALGLRPANREDDPAAGLAFDFLSDADGPVTTGHDNGLITLNLTEADDAERERIRKEMGEPYRTLLGHFRHEVGHYFWQVLVQDAGRLTACRAVFGDDRADYGTALKAHYANGAPADWQDNFVSAYASAHPWEDFAETWAHYLHITDTLEMAASVGLHVRPAEDLAATPAEPTAHEPIETLIDHWLPVALAVNSLNRCMGQPDLYPFVLSPAVIGKLGFIHDLVHGRVPQDETSAPEST